VTQPLDLNLASHPFRNNTLLWAAHVAAGGSLLAFSAWNANAFLEESRALKDLEGRSAQIERKLAELDLRDRGAQAGIARHDLKDLDVQSATANRVIQMKALSWTRLFNLLESVVPHEVKTVAVRPAFASAASRGPGAAMPDEAVPVAIQGIAQSLEAFLEFERSLIVDRHFAQVEPEKTDMLQGAEIAFEVRFLYFPDGRAAGTEPPDLPHVLAAAASEPASLEEPLPEVAAPIAAEPAAPLAGAQPSAGPGDRRNRPKGGGVRKR